MPWAVVSTATWALAIFGVGSAVARGGVLDTLREDVRTNDASTSPPGKNANDSEARAHAASHDDCCCDDDDDGFYHACGVLVWYGATAPFWGPHELAHDDFQLDGAFPAYPYEDDRRGYQLIGSGARDVGRPFAARFSGQYGDDFADLSHAGGRFELETATRLGIDSQFFYRRERLSQATDELWTGDFNLVFRFAQCQAFQMRAGLGFNWMADELDEDFGFNFTYGGDWYPVQPLVVSASLDWGTLGDAEAFHIQATVGALWRGIETYVGYDYLDIDRAHIHGLIGGVRLWF